MQILNLIISVIALIIATAAFQRTGGIKNLKKTTAELLSEKKHPTLRKRRNSRKLTERH